MSSDDRIGPRDLMTLLDAQEILKREGMEPVQAVVNSLLRALAATQAVLRRIADGEEDDPAKAARELMERVF